MDQPQILTKVTDELREKLRKSFSIGVMAGAGISVHSGILTLRGANTGKYFQKHNPIYLSSIKGFSNFPKIAWEYFCHIYGLVKKAEPNLAHRALAAWQKEAARRRVVKLHLLTTNFDGLINSAKGKAEEIHGNIQKAICSNCKITDLMENIDLINLPPLCEKCGNILLPDIVLLDGFIQKNHYDLWVDISRACSLYILIGTSGVNSHAYGFMKSVKLRPNTTLIEINLRPSHLTKDMHYVLRGTAEDILPQFDYGEIE